jgi:hypothetical protein
MSAGPQYISKLTGDLVVEETVTERRLADPGWMRRHKRSLGRNKHFRACVRADHELREAMARMHKQAEKDHASDASIKLKKNTTQRVSGFFGRVRQVFARMFTRKSATS